MSFLILFAFPQDAVPYSITLLNSLHNRVFSRSIIRTPTGGTGTLAFESIYICTYFYPEGSIPSTFLFTRHTCKPGYSTPSCVCFFNMVPRLISVPGELLEYNI